MADHFLSKHTVNYGDGVSTRDVTHRSSTRPVGWIEWPTKGGTFTARTWKSSQPVGVGATAAEALANATWPTR